MHERRAGVDGQTELEQPGRLRGLLGIALVGVKVIGPGMAGFGVKSLVDNERFLARAAVADGVVVSVVEAVEREQRGRVSTHRRSKRRSCTRSCGSPPPARRSCSSRPARTATRPPPDRRLDQGSLRPGGPSAGEVRHPAKWVGRRLHPDRCRVRARRRLCGRLCAAPFRTPASLVRDWGDRGDSNPRPSGPQSESPVCVIPAA
jgi:hypothetical protein